MLPAVAKTVRHFRNDPQIRVWHAEERPDLLYMRLTPQAGELFGGEYIFWVSIDNATEATLFPDRPIVVGCLTPSGIFSTVTEANEKRAAKTEPAQTEVTLSTGAVSICLPGLAGTGHVNEFAIARQGTPKQAHFLNGGSVQPAGPSGELLYVTRIPTSGKHAGMAVTMPVVQHGGDLSNMLHMFAMTVCEGRDGFDISGGAEQHGFSVEEKRTAAEVARCRKQSQSWNRRYLPKVVEAFEESFDDAAGPSAAAVAPAAPPVAHLCMRQSRLQAAAAARWRRRA